MAYLRTTLVLNDVQLGRVIVCLALVSLLLLVGTALATSFYSRWQGSWGETPLFWKLMLHTLLTRENVVAVWFSSMLLLTASLGAIVCFVADQQNSASRTLLSFGWLLFAALFAALSADELGSFHERIPNVDGALGWLLWLGPFLAAVPLFILSFGWFHLRRNRRAFGLLVAGVACFTSIPAQEFIETSTFATAGQDWQRPIPLALLEEGTELVGMLLFVAATWLYARDAGRAGLAPRGRSEVPIHLPVRTIVIGLGGVFCTFLACLAILGPPPPLDEGQVGILNNWFPMVLAALTAGVSLQLHAEARREVLPERRIYVLLTTSSLFASAYVGGNVYDYFDASLFERFVGCAGVVIVAVGLLSSEARAIGRASIVLWALILSLIILVPHRNLVAPGMLLAFGILLLGLVGRFSRCPTS